MIDLFVSENKIISGFPDKPEKSRDVVLDLLFLGVLEEKDRNIRNFEIWEVVSDEIKLRTVEEDMGGSFIFSFAEGAFWLI